MATPLLLAQQVFSALTNSIPTSPSTAARINGTLTNATIPDATTQSAGLPGDISSLISFLISFSALREWLKILVFGSVLESLRRVAFHLYYKVYNSFFITARFDEDDASYGAYHYSTVYKKWI